MDVTEAAWLAAGLGGLSIHPHHTAPRHTAINCIIFLILVNIFQDISVYCILKNLETRKVHWHALSMFRCVESARFVIREARSLKTYGAKH